ncbi:MAG: TfoX/Sxy family protein [Limnohabitans sp.]
MSQFPELILETLRASRPVTARRMFGGYGLYHAGVMFALLADRQVYLKCVYRAFQQALPSSIRSTTGKSSVKIKQ